MFKKIALMMIYIILFCQPLKAIDYDEKPRRQEEKPDEKTGTVKTTSSSRGCHVALPKVAVWIDQLKQEKPEIWFKASQTGHKILISIYALDSDEHWQTSATSQTDWESIMPPLRLDRGRSYAFALVVPCHGSIAGGEKLYEVISFN